MGLTQEHYENLCYGRDNVKRRACRRAMEDSLSLSRACPALLGQMGSLQPGHMRSLEAADCDCCTNTGRVALVQGGARGVASCLVSFRRHL